MLAEVASELPVVPVIFPVLALFVAAAVRRAVAEPVIPLVELTPAPEVATAEEAASLTSPVIAVVIMRVGLAAAAALAGIRALAGTALSLAALVQAARVAVAVAVGTASSAVLPHLRLFARAVAVAVLACWGKVLAEQVQVEKA